MRLSNLLLSTAVGVALIACTGAEQPSDSVKDKAAATVKAISHKVELATPKGFEARPDNPLLADYAGPYGGVPAFDLMALDDLKPAMEWGMAKNLAEVDLIANNPDAPTFGNTILALEKSGDA